MKLIFCDFDGVLHPASCEEDERFGNAPLLLDAIKGFEANVGIVITSGHRNSYELDELKAMLPSGIRKFIVGITPRCSGQFPRFEEIKAYVEQNAPDSDWRAIDDEQLWFPKPCPQLILCKSMTGFDRANAATLRAWLEG